MKKTYKLLAGLIALSSVVSLDVSAQFSGNYTINSALATGGTNYQTFAAFANSITSVGISGPVTVDVVAGSGPYIEQITLGAIAGTSSTNTITINGNGNTITYAASAAATPWTVLFAGADYVTVNTLTISGTGSTYAMSLHLYNQSNENRFNSCYIEAPMTGSGQYLVPVSLSGSNNNIYSTGQCGINNVFTGCTMTGGYAAYWNYGDWNTPYVTGNNVINCNIRDFHTYGIYCYYISNQSYNGNIIERLNRTNFGFSYGISLGYNYTGFTTVSKNKIRRMFDASPSTSTGMYGIRVQCYGQSSTPNKINNNLISDISSNGTIYGIYEGGYGYSDIDHNSIVLDNATSTGGTVYGFMTYGDNTIRFRNNLVSVDRTGSAGRYCLYISNAAISNNNILYTGSNAANYYFGYGVGTNYSTFATWQGAGYDLQSATGAPTFVNAATYNYTPNNPVLNNIGATGLGINDDINALARNLPAPDAGAFEFFNQACTSVTGTNAVVTPTNIVCSTDLNSLMLANGYTVNGLSFQWQSAANAIGPFSAIAGATVASYVTPQLPSNTFYNVLISCVNGGLQYTTAVGEVSVAPIVTNTPYYFEGFENISAAGQLPNCSWYRSSTARCKTQLATQGGFRSARTGSAFAEFDSWNTGNTGTQYFWSNGLNLYAGVTYSASVWFVTPGYVTWNNLQLMYGQTQTNSGLTAIATEAQPNSSTYKSLSATFNVPTSGLYYIAVKATDNWSYSNLVWDDLEVMIPCSLPANGAPVVIAGSSTVCAGTPVNITASGAGTYTWNTGSNSNVISPSPLFNTTYTVVGTNTISGCSTLVTKNITVHQVPPVGIVGFDYDLCPGESVTLYGTGANSYTWSEGPTVGNSVLVTPQTTTTYTLLGTNYYGCMASTVQQVTVSAPPVIGVTGNLVICLGNSTNLTGTGATKYTWTSPSAYLQAPVVNISPNVTTAFTVTGTDANNCEGSTIIVVAVEACTGIQGVTGSSAKVSVYPNPNNGVFTLELNNGSIKNIEVLDVTGRVVYTASSSNNTSEININELANGVYYIKVKSDNVNEVVKIVKH